jgi:hypothetical protein
MKRCAACLGNGTTGRSTSKSRLPFFVFDMASSDLETSHDSLARQHLRVGWCGLLLFLSLGILLETLHGLKLQFYLDVRNTTRREMWTLSHAHGTLLALIHLAFAASLARLGGGAILLRFASRSLTIALVLLPAGFFLGGLWIQGGDPGLGILLVPAGAVALFLGVALVLRATFQGGDSPQTAAKAAVRRETPDRNSGGPRGPSPEGRKPRRDR